MTEILCRWLNEDLNLTKKFEKSSFVNDFSSGYHLGEIFHKYNLQDDFDAFSQATSATAKLNNFTRLEPTLALLQIPFDTNMAYSIMMKERGIVTRLLYQIYVALQRLQKNKLTGTAIEAMRAPAPINLDHIQTGLYKERLKTLVPREADLTLQGVSDRFRDKKRENDRKILEAQYLEAAEYRKVIDDNKKAMIQRKKENEMLRSKLLAKISAATVNIPKPVPSRTQKSLQHKKVIKKKLAAAQAMDEIAKFESNLKKLRTPQSNGDDNDEDGEQGRGGDKQAHEMTTATSSDEYFRKIKARLEEDAAAREERAKRRRKVLVDQMRAHHAQEEAVRQNQIVQRLLKQSQQERRIAVQLLQARREKEVMKQNRIFLEQQYEARRVKDYQDALDREAEMARLMRQEYAEETRREIRLHRAVMEKQREERYARHQLACRRLVLSLADFALKIAEYRRLADRRVPEKLVREWRRLVVNGLPLYDEEDEEEDDAREREREAVLDAQDLEEYRHAVGEWSGTPPSPTNLVFARLLYRMFDLYQPPAERDVAPTFPYHPVRAAIVGKKFSGKTTVARQFAAHHKIVPLCVDELVREAIDAAAQAQRAREQREQAPAANEERRHSGSSSGGNNSRSSSSAPAVEELVASADVAVKVDIEVFEQTQAEQDEAEGSCSGQEDSGRTAEDAEVAAATAQAPEDFTKRIELGEMAMRHLSAGEAVPDEVAVGMIVERVSRITDGSGWILDGFPTTARQAALLELALSGRELSPDDGAPVKKFDAKKSQLIADPRKTDRCPAPPQPGLDVVILLDVDDEVIIRRATGRMVASGGTGEQFHPEFRPPPFGSLTGVGAERVVPLEDAAFDREQIQNRLLNYHTHTPKVERFYRAASIVVRVDGGVDQEAVYKDAELSLFETLEMIHQMAHHAAVQAMEEAKAAEEARKRKEAATPPPPSPKPDTPPSSGGSRKSGKGSKKSAKGKRGSGKGSGKRARTPSPVSDDAAAPAEPPGPKPGDADYEWAEGAPLAPELYRAAVPLWERSEETYVGTLKRVFARVRGEREEVLRYLHSLRVSYGDFLRRPDCKQAFVHSWQLDHNAFDADVRGDGETKDEMHHRVDDLCERLWDICDARKEENEEERAALMRTGWMEDHLAVLANLYVTVMQCELDRLQDTLNIMRDYYAAAGGKMLAEIGPAGTFLRLPLYNLNSDPPRDSNSPANDSSSNANESTTDLRNSDSQDPPPPPPPESNSRTRIPLVPRGASALEGKLSAGRKSGEGSGSASFREGEERMITETTSIAINAVTNLVASYVAEREAEDGGDGTKSDAAKSGKKSAKKSGKKRGGKKGADEPPPPPPPPDPHAEAKRKLAAKLKEEYVTGLRVEEQLFKFRCELIGERARATVGYLREQAERTFAGMRDWLGERFELEMTAVDHLSATARRHIESGEPIGCELRLDDAAGRCYVNGGVKVIRSPPQSPRPPPVESGPRDRFTVAQLENLLKSFNEINPNGLMSASSFEQVVVGSASAAYDEEIFPPAWRNISPATLNEVVSVLSVDGAQRSTVDWRKFLFLCSDPPRPPTINRLLAMRQEYARRDLAGQGWIIEEQYNEVELWFTRETERVASPADRTLPYPYNRSANLHSFFFHLFADYQQTPARLNYVNMLMYFAMDCDPITGFFNALSIASGKPMPKVTAVKKCPRPPTPQQREGDEEEAEPSPEDEDPSEEATRANDQRPQENDEASAGERGSGARGKESEESNKTAGAASSDEQLMEMTRNYEGDKLEVGTVPPSLVPPQSWHLALHYNSTRLVDRQRFAKSLDSIDPYSMKKILEIYADLDSPEGDALPVQILLKHLVLQDAVLKTKRFEAKDLRALIAAPAPTNVSASYEDNDI